MRSLHQPALVLALAAACACGQYAESLWVPVTYYDFHANFSSANFEPRGYLETMAGLHKGMVRDTLSADRKPALRNNMVFNNRVNQWYRPSGAPTAVFSVDQVTSRGTWSNMNNYLARADEWVGRGYVASDSMADVVMYDSLLFRLIDIRTGMYEFADSLFLPLDGRGFGAEPGYYATYGYCNVPTTCTCNEPGECGYHNFSFSMELHRDFTYRTGLVFRFSGDDDVWAFVNNRLAMDIGGIHGELSDSIDLPALGLAPGQVCRLDFFFAERHVNESHIRITANVFQSPFTVVALVPVPSPGHDQRPLLRWHPGEFSMLYTLQVSTSPQFTSTLLSAVVTDTFYQVPADLPVGTVYWRVQANNSTWSTVGSFVILDGRVPVVIPYMPDPTIDRTPQLTWHAPPQPGPSYVVQVSTSPVFADLLPSGSVSDTTCIVDSLLPYDTIYWRVRSSNSAVWSDVDTFRLLPDTVVRLVRYDGAELATSRPDFAWHPVPGATGYRVQVANNSLFFRASQFDVGDTAMGMPSDLINTMWYWRVSSSRDWGLWSDIDSFVVNVPVGVRPAVVQGRDGRRPVAVTVFDLAGREVGRAVLRRGWGGLRAGVYVTRGAGRVERIVTSSE